MVMLTLIKIVLTIQIESMLFFFFFQAEDGIRDYKVTGVQTCALPIYHQKKMVLKYVTKKRILVDTWTRDRRLGTVPLEIHVLDFLRRDGYKDRKSVV